MTPDIVETIRGLEERLLRADLRRSAAQLEFLLADDFLEFGKSGRVWNKPSVIALLAAESGEFTYSLEDFRVALLAPTVALATYRISDATPGAAPQPALRSSVWVNRDGNWRLTFHQGTSVEISSLPLATDEQ
jgi:hypothetical protein